jgi:hypothetical protein
MNNYTKQLQAELEDSGCAPIFEIEVIDSEGFNEYIQCEVFFKGNSLVAQRDAVSTKEQASKFIASTRILTDSAFSLDAHLGEILEAAQEDILQGDLYTLV